ncbi:hypothetical protein DD595_26020 [Enterobacter cloacae complex sp. 4DZ3-17B2]|nr:hypothetical protein DD595_26020 [Enterobacter cloacae complex sp. 4DZ3-17B2]
MPHWQRTVRGLFGAENRAKTSKYSVLNLLFLDRNQRVYDSASEFQQGNWFRASYGAVMLPKFGQIKWYLGGYT